MDATAPAPPSVSLAPVTRALRAVVESLSVAPDQARLVATNAESLAEADQDPDARPRVVLEAGRPVGFAMFDASDMLDVRIYRFMIDAAAQGRGLGRAALHTLLKEIEALGHVRRVSICYEPDNFAARRLYLSGGFVEEGLDEDGEMVAALSLSAGKAEV